MGGHGGGAHFSLGGAAPCPSRRTAPGDRVGLESSEIWFTNSIFIVIERPKDRDKESFVGQVSAKIK